MFGELIHYHGPIKYQGQGTPHAHLVVCSSPLCSTILIIVLALDKRQWITSFTP